MRCPTVFAISVDELHARSLRCRSRRHGDPRSRADRAASRGVEELPSEALDARDVGNHGGRQHPDRQDDEACGDRFAGVEVDSPCPRLLVPRQSGHAGVERDVASEVESVGDVLQVAKRLGLSREVLAPVSTRRAARVRTSTRRSSSRSRTGRPGSGSSTRCRRRHRQLRRHAPTSRARGVGAADRGRTHRRPPRPRRMSPV